MGQEAFGGNARHRLSGERLWFSSGITPKVKPRLDR